MTKKTEKRIESMSKSRLSMFLNCGHAYKQKYIEKAEASNTTDCSALVRGICVHELTELIDKDLPFSDEFIIGTFLTVFSQRIGRDIQITNLDELSKSFDIDNHDEETIKYQLYHLSYDAYKQAEFEYKEEMDKIIPLLPLYIQEYINIKDKLTELSQGFVEKRENTELKITNNLSVLTTQIFDRLFFMSFDDVIEIERPEVTLETVTAELDKKYKKEELILIGESYELTLPEKGLKKDYAEIVAKYELPIRIEENEARNEAEKEVQRNFLYDMGYKKGSMIPVIMEIKSTAMSKTEQNISDMIDPYIYSMFFYENYKVLPVFMILYLVVTKTGKTKHQIFTNYISKKQLKNVKNNFISDCKRIFLRREYKKNFMAQNFLCNEKKCKYYDDCQRDLSLIVTTKK